MVVRQFGFVQDSSTERLAPFLPTFFYSRLGDISKLTEEEPELQTNPTCRAAGNEIMKKSGDWE